MYGIAGSSEIKELSKTRRISKDKHSPLFTNKVSCFLKVGKRRVETLQQALAMFANNSFPVWPQWHRWFCVVGIGTENSPNGLERKSPYLSFWTRKRKRACFCWKGQLDKSFKVFPLWAFVDLLFGSLFKVWGFWH